MTVICRFDAVLEVQWSKAGATESSAGASLTHVGQSSVEIGLMNRGERAEWRSGGVGSSFNIARHVQWKHQSSGQEAMERSEGGHLSSSKGDPSGQSPAAGPSGAGF